MQGNETGIVDRSAVLPGAYKAWLGVERGWWVLAVVALASFMSGLDSSVVNTVLPIIGQSLGADFSTVEWVPMAYVLTLSVFLLGFGRLGDIVGDKLVFNVGFAVFALGSLLCTIAPTVELLIAFRAFQALGSAMLNALGPVVATRLFPREKRGQVLGLQASMVYVGLTLGPPIGGFLTDHFGWRSIFLIDLPTGVLGTVLALLIIPRSAGGKRESFDFRGAVAMMVGLTALMFALSKGQSLSWTSPFILGLFAVAVVALALFFWLERVVSVPMVDLSLFRNRRFSGLTLAAFINYICGYSVVFLLPFYLVQGRGFAPVHVGLFMSAQPIVQVVVAPLAGWWSDRIRSTLPLTMGMAVYTAGMFALSGMDAQSSDAYILVTLALMGFATGSFNTPTTSAILGAAPRSQQGIAASITALARNLGFVFGIAISGAVFSTQLAQRALGQADSQAAFFGAIHDTFFVMGLIGIVGVAGTLVRETRRTPVPGSAEPG